MSTTPPEDCGGLVDMVKCGVGGAIGDAVGGAASTALDKFVESIAEAIETMLAAIGTVWMRIPSPTLVAGDGQPTGVIAAISNDLSFYTIVFAMLGVLFAVGKMGVSGRGDAGLPAARMVVTLAIVTAAGASVVSAGIAAGDAFAPWIIERATGQPFSDGVKTVMSPPLLVGSGPGFGLLVGLAALIGTIAQIVFMVFRGALITLLMAVLPTIAATSATQGGSAALRKALGWLLAFVLYKPVAAVIYAVGFLLVKGTPSFGGDEKQQALMSLLTGLTVIVLAALTLPALVKFLVPVASAGVSSLFSGAAVGVAALATGAAVVSMGGSAGAGAMARGAAPVASSSGSASSSGAASTAGKAAGGPAGASVTGGGGGPAGGGSAPTGGGSTGPAGGGGGTAPSTGGGAPAGGGSGATGTGPVPGATDGAAPAGGGTAGSGGATPGPAAPAPAGGSARPGGGSRASGSHPAARGGAAAPVAPTPAPAPAPAQGAPAAPSGARSSADRWKAAARGATEAARAGNQAADEGGAGPSGAAVER